MLKSLLCNLSRLFTTVCLFLIFHQTSAQSITPLKSELSNSGAISPVFTMAYMGINYPVVAFGDEEVGGKATVRNYFQGKWNTVGQAGFSPGRIKEIAIAVYWFSSRPYVLFSDSQNGNKATMMAISDYNTTATWNKHTNTYPESQGTGILSKGAASNMNLYDSGSSFYAAFCDEGNGGKITVLYHGADYGKNPIKDSWFSAGTASTGRASNVKLTVGTSTPFVVYADADNGNKATVRRGGGYNWASMGTPGFSEGAVSYTSIALNSSGVPYVAYIDSALGNKPVVKRYNGTTQSWEDVGPSPSAYAASHTTLTVNGSNVYLAFNDAGNSKEGKFLSFNSSTNTWNNFGPKLSVGVLPNQCLKDDYDSYLLYTDSKFSNRAIVKTSKTYDAYDIAWRSLGAAQYSPLDAKNTVVSAVGESEYMFYNDKLNNDVIHQIQTGGNITFSVSTGKAGRFSLNTVGNEHYAAIVDQTNSHRIVVRMQKRVVYQTVTTAIGSEPVSPTAADYPSITIGKDMYVAYQDTIDKKITVKKLNSTQTNWDVVGQAGFAKGRDITLKQVNNIPYIAFTDLSGADNTYRVKVMRFNPESNTWELVANGNFANAIAGYSSLAFANNTPYIVYQDLSNAEKATVKRLNKLGTAWETAGIAGFSASKADYLSIAINGITPFVIYQDHSKSLKATLQRFNPENNAWTVIDSAGFSKWPAAYTSIAFANSRAILGYSSDGALVQTFETKLPMIDSFSPDSSQVGNIVNITGKNFTNVSEVRFGGIPATSFTVNSPTSITAVVGKGRSGEVRVKTASGVTEKPGFIFKAIANIADFEPKEAPEGTEITIHGSKFNNVTAVQFGDSTAKSFKVLSDKLITAIVGKGASGNVAVTADGGMAEREGFTFIMPPSIAKLSPDNGATGDTVIISGENFTGISTVKFGGVNARSYTVRSRDTIIAIVGNGASGDVTLQGTTGVAQKSGFTFYGIPSIVSISPSLAAKGDTVKITGTNLNGAKAVSFGKTAAKSFIVNSATSITAIVDGGASGSVSITTPGGTASRTGFTFIPAPTLTAFSPSSAASGSKVTLTGTNFTGIKSISMGGVPVQSFTLNSASSVSVIVGAGASGTVSLTARGGSASKTGFTFIEAPQIAAFSPLSAASAQTVTIKGSKFTGTSAVKFGPNAASSFTVVSDSIITAIVGKGSSGVVSVTAPGGTTTLGGFIFIPAPTITGFTPLLAGAGTKVTIAGTNFSNTSSVSFGGVPASSFTVNSSNSITAIIASGATGAVSVSTTGGTASRSGFTFLDAPTISAFSPASAGKGKTVTITGSNFKNVSALRFGGIPAASFRVLSSTSISAVLGTGASGEISVTTGGGSASISGFSYIDAPLISSFSPLSAPTGTRVTITGSNLANASSVKFGNKEAASFIINSPTSITAIVGPGATGAVSVITPGGSGSRNGFVYQPAPEITSFSPANASTGTKVTIRGQNFNRITSVSFGGSPAQSFTVNSSTILTAIVGNGSSGAITLTGETGTGSKSGFTYFNNQIVVSAGGSSIFEYQKLNNPGNNIIVYPNPFEKALILDFPEKEKSGKASIKIFATNGSLVHEQSYTIVQGTLGLNLEMLLSGTYTLIVGVDGKDYSYKVIKK